LSLPQAARNIAAANRHTANSPYFFIGVVPSSHQQYGKQVVARSP
jgi:hypothetical protein